MVEMKSPNRYSEEDDKVEPSLKLGVCEVKSKSWFHSLYYVDEYLASSHIDVLFYYLRKKFLYGHSVVTFITTDLIFDRCIQSIYKKYCQVNKRKKIHFDLSMINVNTTVVDYIIGYDIACGRPWSEVDHILFSIHCIDMEHWVMGRLSAKEKTIYLYNSLKTNDSLKVVAEAVKAYSSLLPRFLSLVAFYGVHPNVVLGEGAYSGDPNSSMKVVVVKDIPLQTKNDCGVFVAWYTEYFVARKKMDDEAFDVENERSRFSHLLYNHAKMKQQNGDEDDNDIKICLQSLSIVGNCCYENLDNLCNHLNKFVLSLVLLVV